MRLDPGSRSVTVGGEPVALTPREFDLLELLMEAGGEVVRREDIMERLWHEHWFGSTKTLDQHVSSLRRKLEPVPARPRVLLTVRGVGYRVAGPDEGSR